MTTALVVGSSGYVGSRLVAALVSRTALYRRLDRHGLAYAAAGEGAP